MSSFNYHISLHHRTAENGAKVGSEGTGSLVGAKWGFARSKPWVWSEQTFGAVFGGFWAVFGGVCKFEIYLHLCTTLGTKGF